MNRWTKPQMTGAQALAQMQTFLWGCTEATLAKLTPDELQRWHKVGAKDAEYWLTIVRQKRLAS